MSIIGSADELQKSADIVDDIENNQNKKKLGFYPWFVLGMLFLMRISMNWSRKSLSYIYGFQGSGAFKGDPMFEITQVYPALDQTYGLL